MTPARSLHSPPANARPRGAVLGSCASLLGWDERTYMPREGLRPPRRTDGAPGPADARNDDGPRRRRAAGRRRGKRSVRDPVSDAAVNVREIRRTYDRAVKLPQRLVEELARVSTLRPAGLAGGAAGRRLRGVPAVAGKDRRAETRGGAGGRLQGRPLRRPAGRVRAGAEHRRDHPRLRGLARGIGPAGAGDRGVGPQGAARHSGAGISGGAAAGVRPCGGGGDRLRLRGRPAGRDDAPVLQRHRPRRLPHHHALQPALLQRVVLRHPPRVRPRHLRAGAAGRASRHAAAAVTPRWESTNRNRDCGRIRSAAAGRSGTTSSRRRNRHFPRRCAT